MGPAAARRYTAGMEISEATGPFCQSCGMPLQNVEDFGTASDGLMAEDYCRFCFQSGLFTEPDLTMKGMIDRSVDFMGRRELIPNLKRWRQRRP